jgi:hypothetical protein
VVQMAPEAGAAETLNRELRAAEIMWGSVQKDLAKGETEAMG